MDKKLEEVSIWETELVTFSCLVIFNLETRSPGKARTRVNRRKEHCFEPVNKSHAMLIFHNCYYNDSYSNSVRIRAPLSR